MDNRRSILLNAIRARLDILLQRHSGHSVATAALEHVQSLLMDFSEEVCNLLINELTSLQTERLWDDSESEEDKELLNELDTVLKEQFTNTTATTTDLRTSHDIDMVKFDLPNQKIPQILRHDLPPEILDCINETYLLHSVAMHPSRVLPPGKSILSILSARDRSASSSVGGDNGLKTLTQEVGNIMLRAFWDKALDSLSSPSAAIQLSRLRLLYMDLHKAVESLVPPTLSIVYTLTHPLSPTSSPLRSASVHLKELLVVLRARCAPIRDTKFAELSSYLENASYEELPRACIDVIKGILELADLMKADMADFITGTWTEKEAVHWLRQQSISRERSSAIKMFTLPKLKDLYQTWLSEVSEPGVGVESESGQDEAARLVDRLVRALGKNEPVSPFPPSTNLLPPPMMYFAFDFIRIQNLLQALVITASLRLLVHPYLKEKSNDWLTRIWTLLELEIDMGVQDTQSDDGIGTRLVNLEDEVLSVSRSQGAEGEHLRETVRRILRVEDPAFKLLQGRLLEVIRKRLSDQLPESRVPNSIKSGRGNPILHGKEQFELVEENLFVKGFEEPVLTSNVRDVTLFIRRSLVWFRETWAGILF